ncbi:GDSL-like Lipase/Acylhydrolase [Butyrivibrio fibrisolvens DSM 3071]|uniref:GDSL-like Lipase/Acylhydrolase n=1 Tax=Butyrivibrio fibrisolvens DSM 3071 TaxID=1121131 RepID=A0A1M6F9Q1_BUTFI|nr:SGNH/GDSL hydrolase family protein [Butyrivibrio fibrisolvens]SHI94405.1 GDSL-like Lipase/Acylhydrolase [Butyrivibrio fibrisolvens DSM 3071]
MSTNNSLSITSLIVSIALITGCTSPAFSSTGASTQSSSVNVISSTEPSQASSVSTQDPAAGSTVTASDNSSTQVTSAEPSEDAPVVTKDPYGGGNEPVPDGDLQLVFIGDSQFDRWRNSSTSISELVGEEMNALHYNLGVGGTCAGVERSQSGFNASNDQNDYEEANFTAICHMLRGEVSTERYSNILNQEFNMVLDAIKPELVDYYIIEYGYNDYYTAVDMYNEEDPYDEHTFYGALNQGIKLLKEISPNAHFIICTPCYCRFYNGSGKDMGDAYNVTKGLGSLAYYADYALKLADNIGARKLDAIGGGAFNLNSYTYKEYLEDSVHLSYRGRVVYAKALRRIILDDMGIYDSEGEGSIEVPLSIANY